METLRQAARLHHVPALSVKEGALSRLPEEMLSAGSPLQSAPWGFGSQPAEAVIAILRAFHGIPPAPEDDQIPLLAEILTLSNILDEQLRPTMAAPASLPEIWISIEGLRGVLSPRVMDAAHQALDRPFRVEANCRWEFPVQPLVAKEILLTLTVNRSYDVMVLSSLAGRDPVMAGKLIQTANSALYNRQSPVRSIIQAVSYIGTEATRKVLLALAFQRLTASSQLARLWRHSVWMAQYCEALASHTGLGPPDEALLAGLVHDIGLFAMASLPRKFGAARAFLMEHGCPPCYAEQLLLGQDHGWVGAEVLLTWRFPASLVEAIRFHHRPADSDSWLASMLYLAEHWAETDEDVAARRHFDAALKRTGCSLETLAQVQHLDPSLEQMLRIA